MPKFSAASLSRLNTCHPKLVHLFTEIIKEHDCIIICGARSDFDQQKAFKDKKSKLDGIIKKSKHQVDKKNPFSRAVDVAPCPLDWNNKQRFFNFAGKVLAKADTLGIKIRWGGDWDGDKDYTNNKFNDLPHFELLE